MTSRFAIVTEARRWIGTPYHHQQSLHGVGCDCLGLVRGVWRSLYGQEPELVPGYSPDWGEIDHTEPLLSAARRHLFERDLNAFQTGDVLVFRWRPNLPAKHCAILVEGPSDATQGRMVHAYDGAGFVAEGSIAPWVAKLAGVFSFPEVE